MDNKRIVIFGGGTIFPVRCHLALGPTQYEPPLVADAGGETARRLADLAKVILPNMDVDLRLTKMAGGSKRLNTNADVESAISEIIQDDLTKVVIMSAALCDFEGEIVPQIGEEFIPSGKYAQRLLTSDGEQLLRLKPAKKLIGLIRKTRKDIFLVGFKTTCNASSKDQYLAGLNLCKKSSCNLVLANDVGTRLNMIVTPEESKYAMTTDREAAERELMEMIFHRTHMTFTRSTVVAGEPVKWESDLVPPSLRAVVEYCISNNAYKPFNGVTAGHFACKLDDTTFLTSIRRTNFNDLAKNGMVKCITDGPDTVLAYGAKPSVGGQSQRIVFRDHPGLDCIVHFHCPIKSSSLVPSVSQREFECGSHQCGQNTSSGLKQFGNLWAVYLDNHGPNIVFNKSIDPKEVIDFIETNFDLSAKTDGFTSIKSRLESSNTLETAFSVLG